MRILNFTPTGLGNGSLYTIEIYFDPNNPILKQTITNAPDGVQIAYTVTDPGVYTIKAINPIDNTCFHTTNVELFFPVVTFFGSDVDCGDNTYSVSITLVNPLTAGTNVQYGYSLINNVTSVSNWSSSNILGLPADGNSRYMFVQNAQCSSYIGETIRQACVNCSLTLSNIQFICN